ncbi:class I SAM-dependent methyltransferase [Pseudomonas sp. CAN2814]|uniref:class I SAM-dependent methyltransferase n=1 Tax=Pseudomonas sp. CAN1 TaxID=3046726 RepID=UPI00264723B0|nr:class I SAM-dependent methyltransferase [Pseudomonas sp. CAN1]MDN6855252.1 class I SAM-dependent methyltransferase [Pseudomonas sp. CAN1]
MTRASAWRKLRERFSEKPASAPVAQITFDSDTQRTGLIDAVKGGWFRNDSHELFKGFPIAAEDVVLDLGCGAGGATLFCARQGASVIFTDSEAAKVEGVADKVAQTTAREARGIVSDSLPLPLPDATASRIVALEVLEHVEQPEAILAELNRVGKPGALYFLSVPAQQSEELQRELAPAGHFCAPNHINVFSAEAFAAAVQGAGLEIVSRHSYGFFWTLWMMIYWTTGKADGQTFEGATHDLLAPPFSPLLEEWSRLWLKTISLPGGELLRDKLDAALPKTQIILARKPGVPGAE